MNRIFKFSNKRSRVPTSLPTKTKSVDAECHNSSSISLGGNQRRSVAPILNSSSITEKEISYFMELDKDGNVNERRKDSFLRYYESLDFNDRKSVASILSSSAFTEQEISYIMEPGKDGAAGERNVDSFLRYYNSKADLNRRENQHPSCSSTIAGITVDSETQGPGSRNYDTSFGSSIHAEKCSHDLESIEDFVVPMSSLKKHNTKSKKKRKPQKRKSIQRTFRHFVRKTLKLPLNKKHQRWSRFSFDSSILSFDSSR